MNRLAAAYEQARLHCCPHTHVALPLCTVAGTSKNTVPMPLRTCSALRRLAACCARIPHTKAQAEVAWRVLDGRGQCLGAGGGSGSGSNGGNSSSNSSSSNGNQAPHALLPETVVTVRPHSAAVAAVLRSSSAVLVASTYPPDVTAAALAAAGLSDVQERILHTVHAPSFSACAAQLAPLLVPRRADSSSNSGPRRSPTVPLLIASSPARAAAAAAVLHSEAMSWGLQQPLPVPVAEWACAAPRLRARALARRDGGLLSEVELAELLGVTGCDAVMDCVAWRA